MRIANSLCAKLRAADAAAQRGQPDTKSNILRAFINEVEAQRGKAIATADADVLIRMANAL